MSSCFLWGGEGRRTCILSQTATFIEDCKLDCWALVAKINFSNKWTTASLTDITKKENWDQETSFPGISKQIRTGTKSGSSVLRCCSLISHVWSQYIPKTYCLHHPPIPIKTGLFCHLIVQYASRSIWNKEGKLGNARSKL